MIRENEGRSERGQLKYSCHVERSGAMSTISFRNDALNPFFQMALSFFLYWAGQYNDAITQARKTLEMDPNSAITRVLLGLSFLKKGDTAGAIAAFQNAKTPNPGAWYQVYLGHTYATSGDRTKAEQCLGELEQLAKHEYVSPTAFATVYLRLGDKKSFEDHAGGDIGWIRVDPLLDSLRGDPRFEAFAEKIVAAGEFRAPSK